MIVLISAYNLKLTHYLVYMLQQVEYDPHKFSSWTVRQISKNRSFSSVTSRQTLHITKRARLLLVSTYITQVLLIFINFLITKNLAYLSLNILLSPVVSFLWLYGATYFAHTLIIKPEQQRLVAQAKNIFSEHKGIKIAVLGSYGKTSMKELLQTVLSEKFTVASTPGNMNVSVSHARFAQKLKGTEDILIVEFGEGAPGDIKRMADMLKPTIAVVTGLAPNHLDNYNSLDEVARDLFSIYDYLPEQSVFVSCDSNEIQKYLKNNMNLYSVNGSSDFTVSNVEIAVDGLQFKIRSSDNHSIKIQSKLIGAHQIGPITVVATIAKRLGMSDQEIKEGISNAVPYEHRMQPRLLNGAWIIDDTYNGSIEGMRAGLAYLSAIKAKRKWYVTPGLVDQGKETVRVHKELGELIAKAKPDVVVLMKNSTTEIIMQQIESLNESIEVRIVDDPLQFYTNIEHEIAAGDILLMQNDWTDNYA